MSKKPTGPDGQSDDQKPGATESQAEDVGSESEETAETEGSEEESRLDLDSLPEATQKYLKDLRKENARYRNQAKRLEADFTGLKSRLKSVAGGEDGDEEIDPDEYLQGMYSQVQSAAFENATLREAIRHGVTGDDSLEYFQFLLAKRCEALEEDEELDESEIVEIAKKAKGKSVPASTSVQDTPAKPASGDEITVDAFLKMSMLEKGKLFDERPALYKELFEKAKKNIK